MKQSVRRIFTVLRVATAAGLLYWLFSSGAIEWSTLGRLAFAWPFALVGLLILVLDLLVTSWRVCVILRPSGLRLPLGASFRLTLIGLFFNMCLPGGASGDVVRIYYATGGHRERAPELTAILLLDRIAGMFAMISWPLVVGLFFVPLVQSEPLISGLLWLAGGVAAGMIGFFALALWGRVGESSVLAWTFDRLPLGDLARRIFHTVHGYRHHVGTLVAAVGISYLAHSLAVSAMMLFAVGMNPEGFTWAMGLLLPLGFLANAIPLTPGGLGVGEAAFDQLFGLVGMGGGAEVLIAWRILMLLTSLTGLVFYVRGRRRFIDVATGTPGPDSKVCVVEAEV